MILADESVDAPIVAALRAAGRAVAYIAEDAAGVTDDVVLERANAATALLLTADKDFGEMVYRQKRTHHGVVLLRLAGLSSVEKTGIVLDAFHRHEAEFVGCFVVIGKNGIRIRST